MRHAARVVFELIAEVRGTLWVIFRIGIRIGGHIVKWQRRNRLRRQCIDVAIFIPSVAVEDEISLPTLFQ